MTVAELVQYLFEDQQHRLEPQFEAWVRESRRFRGFAEDYRDKIRKKLRTSPDEEALASLLIELETAYLLLHDQRFTLEYEKLAASGGRAPDFTATFRVNTVFHIEVTRLRKGSRGVGAEDDSSKLIEMVFEKVGQMTPNSANLVILGSMVPVGERELVEAMADLRRRAEHKQEDYFTRHRFESAAAFLRQFRHLSAILYRGDDAALHGNLSFIWLNSLAKHRLSRELHNALRKVFAMS